MSTYLNLLSSALDGSAKRGELIANNIANVSTPGYKRQDNNFKSYLATELNGSSKLQLSRSTNKHLAGGEKLNNQNRAANTSYRNDQNNVDIEVEMAEMAKNTIYYNVISTRAAAHFRTVNQVVQQGG
ncbi:flagellar basal body rod protein FlgB [Halanaerobium sp. Z-7514]|uniref:Flagellar basal body rod protein FlgB n=1 Tax=Halanaerobium polyolivorans TaxID=2886943 RepID=A0AAW4X082_9FIRM|nr:flagellar basal body rod protein FlgB [Halanaerobium polyolivorans]MCC3145213.1 flagellar basal body rod protein FlgB [Halanaerobium polyolivorans]